MHFVEIGNAFGVENKVDPQVVHVFAFSNLDAVIRPQRDVHQGVALHRVSLIVDQKIYVVFGKAEEKLVEERMGVWFNAIKSVSD